MYRLPLQVRSTYGQDGAVLLDIRSGQMFRVNLVGSRILKLINDGTSESSIVDDIAKEFDLNKDMVRTDVREFVEHLKQKCLVEDSGVEMNP